MLSRLSILNLEQINHIWQSVSPVFLQDLTKTELAAFLLPLSRLPRRDSELPIEAQEKKKQKQASLRAKQIFKWAYQRHARSYDEMSDLAKDIREVLKETLPIFQLKTAHEQQSNDGTYKFLWSLEDNKTIESVIIPAALKEKVATDKLEQLQHGKKFSGLETDEFELDDDLRSDDWARLTACISSQVGCAMACKFCLTGVQGLDRSLSTHEVVAQIAELRARAPITNIVFMGMGEPLHNVDNIGKACSIFLDEDGFNFSKRKVTVSTSGLVPAIDKLYQQTDVQLAVSLNASNDEQRSKIMPVNKRYPIAELLAACKKLKLGPHRRITFEYVLLKDFNDAPEDALRVAKLLRGLPSKVNLIPFNEHSGSEYQRPSDDVVFAFQKILLDQGYTATVRISRGRDISAACGQLRSLFGTARGTERHKDAPSALA